MQDIHARARRVRLAIFDVDGVLTDGALVFSGSGEELKVFNVLDGHGMKLLQASGVALAVITSRASRAVEERMRNLGIDLLFQGAPEKLPAFNQLIERQGIGMEAASFIGDDLQDLPVLKRCGFAATVPDAPAPVRRHAHYVTRARGGRGAVRELCELIMHAQGTLTARHAEFEA
jgi:3-deoxy-D-manno-octulosonate 8-phosphate phosphatase (KDO 8-P phosphatase)